MDVRLNVSETREIGNEEFASASKLPSIVIEGQNPKTGRTQNNTLARFIQKALPRQTLATVSEQDFDLTGSEIAIDIQSNKKGKKQREPDTGKVKFSALAESNFVKYRNGQSQLNFGAFANEKLEHKFLSFVLGKTLLAYKLTIVATTILLVIWISWGMGSFPAVDQQYLPWKDGLILGFTILPAILALGTVYLFPQKLYPGWHNIFASVYLGCVSVISILFRHLFVLPTHDMYMFGLVLILTLFCCHSFIQIRFVHAFVSLSVTFLTWTIIISTNAVSDENSNQKQSIIGIALGLTTLVLIVNAYRQEMFFRDQFLRGIFSMKLNSKLTSQLQALQRTYTSGAVDLETPLEKSISILRGMIANTSLSRELIHNLEEALCYLNDPQLLSPDFEKQFSGSESHDARSIEHQQRDWLLTEVSKRRQETKSIRRSSSRRKTKLSNYGLPQSDSKLTSYKRDISGSRELTLPESLSQSQSSIHSNETISYDYKDPVNYAQARYLREHSANPNSKPAVDFKSEAPFERSGTKISLLNEIDDWNWKLFDFSLSCPGGKPLFILAWHLFNVNNLFEEFDIPLDKFCNFMWKIQEGYRDVPYHNSLHAADVLHAVNFLCQLEKVDKALRPLELMAVFVAAVIHDFDHPGVNNNFLISTGNPLAILYNDKTVLENYHVSTAFQLLLKPENNFLVNLSKQDMLVFRELVIDMVIATDLSLHYSTVGLFKTRLQNNFDPVDNKDDRFLLYRMLIKCADVSNPTKDFEIYSKWTGMIIDEWRNQGDQEKALSIPVSAFMDRDNPNVLLSSQMGFIDYIITPMYEAFHNDFAKIPRPMEGLERNKQYWKRIKDIKEQDANATTLMVIKKMNPSSAFLHNSEGHLLQPRKNSVVTHSLPGQNGRGLHTLPAVPSSSEQNISTSSNQI